MNKECVYNRNNVEYCETKGQRMYNRNKILNTVKQKDKECLYNRNKYGIIQKEKC